MVWTRIVRPVARRPWTKSIAHASLTQEAGPIVGTTVLRPHHAKDFEASAKWLQEALIKGVDFPGDDVRVIGSPDGEELTKEIEKFARQLRIGRLKGARLVVVVDEIHSARMRTALSRTGANVQLVNPSKQLPQRLDTMQKADSEVSVCLVPPLG